MSSRIVSESFKSANLMNPSGILGVSICRTATGASGNATRHAEIYRCFVADQRGVGAVRLYQARSAGQSTWRTPQHGLGNNQNTAQARPLDAFSLMRILRRQCALSFKNIWPKDRLAKLLVCASCAIQGSRGHLVRLRTVEGQRGAGRVMPPTKPVPAHPTPSVLRRHIYQAHNVARGSWWEYGRRTQMTKTV